jgi:hypothetical protein
MSSSDDYRFLLTEKDPIIPLIQTEVQRLNGGDVTTEFLERLSYKSGVSITTLKAWFFGGTLHPRHLTVRFVLDALELKHVVVRKDGTEVRGPRNVSRLATGITRKPRSEANHQVGVSA